MLLKVTLGTPFILHVNNLANSEITVLISSRRNLFILNKFLISDIILITCRELYFEVVGHVYLIKMGNFPGNEMFSVKDHVQNDTC